VSAAELLLCVVSCMVIAGVLVRLGLDAERHR